ncbi:MAG TPA: serine/threonine protein kinase, partial [Pirellulales bacterium]
LYIPTTEKIYCIGPAEPQTKATPRPEPIAETPVSEDQTPAWVQISPNEVLVKPGDKVAFKVRLYNKKGQFLKDATDAAFTLAPVDAMSKAPAGGFGEIKDGVYTAPAAPNTVGLHVEAKVGELKGMARVRIVPPLPWKFTFDDKQIPLAWIGMRGRNVVREVEGDPMLVKVTTIPKGTRSQGWFGPTNLRDYTIQADVFGTEKDGKMPDIGLTAQRYRFDLMGEHQKIRLYSWIAHEIKYKEFPFTWKPNVWYTMKFKVHVEQRDGEAVAVLQGKIWPRGEKEPAEWTCEATEFDPDLEGSPGLFGNAKDAEIFYDNVTVTPNE